ncbi:uncharacterized protein BDR25DRAFT_312418 [Lindgomyces ingoldianus]|uniref:Uncharacterized protein n=1 Tax=Lindgomyces ingoldianus TaxID=673940 RepID=A0ACB6R2P5_9PLEO|nr:uncharacterized protein BDR25DRAFT_312418 [Lindgomyces ingoldianus]KAF2473327.1 hypothetical protein BDR25DRAFT_312418 [Lindgomyces ingoldianus]
MSPPLFPPLEKNRHHPPRNFSRPFPAQSLTNSPHQMSPTKIAPWKEALGGQYPVAYFFYGAVAEPKALKRVLGLGEEPRVRKAKILGYEKVKSRGGWSVLGREDDKGEVSGVVYMVSSDIEERSLQGFVGVAYRVASVEIEILSHGLRRGRKVEGKTFVYTGDTDMDTDILTSDLRGPDASCDGDGGSDTLDNLLRKLWPLPPEPSIPPPSDSSESSNYRYSRRFTSQNFSVPLCIRPWNHDVLTAQGVSYPTPTHDPKLPERSPSLRLSTIIPRPPTYHGPSILDTEVMLIDRKRMSGLQDDGQGIELRKLGESVHLCEKMENARVGLDLRRKNHMSKTRSAVLEGEKAKREMTGNSDGEERLEEIKLTDGCKVDLLERLNQPLPPLPEQSGVLHPAIIKKVRVADVDERERWWKDGIGVAVSRYDADEEK